MNEQTSRAVDAGREFNQTNEHDHRQGVVCWCGFGEGSTPRIIDRAYASPRAISPAIHEHRVLELTRKLRDSETENAILKERIAGFERLAASLSAHIDIADSNFMKLSGKTPAEYLGLDELD